MCADNLFTAETQRNAEIRRENIRHHRRCLRFDLPRPLVVKSAQINLVPHPYFPGQMAGNRFLTSEGDTNGSTTWRYSTRFHGRYNGRPHTFPRVAWR